MQFNIDSGSLQACQIPNILVLCNYLETPGACCFLYSITAVILSSFFILLHWIAWMVSLYSSRGGEESRWSLPVSGHYIIGVCLSRANALAHTHAHTHTWYAHIHTETLFIYLFFVSLFAGQCWFIRRQYKDFLNPFSGLICSFQLCWLFSLYKKGSLFNTYVLFGYYCSHL